MSERNPDLDKYWEALKLERIWVFAGISPLGELVPLQDEEWQKSLIHANELAERRALRIIIASRRQTAVPTGRFSQFGTEQYDIVLADTLQDGIREIRRRGEMNMSELDKRIDGVLYLAIDEARQSATLPRQDGEWESYADIKIADWMRSIRRYLCNINLVREHLAELELIQSLTQLSEEDVQFFRSRGITMGDTPG